MRVGVYMCVCVCVCVNQIHFRVLGIQSATKTASSLIHQNIYESYPPVRSLKTI